MEQIDVKGDVSTVLVRFTCEGYCNTNSILSYTCHNMLDFIRRFGLAYSDLPTIVDNVAFLLRMSLVNIDRKYTQRIPIIFYVVQIVSGASYFYVYQISMVWFLFVKYQETKDLVVASVIFSLATCSMTGIAKLFYMRINNDKIMDLVEEYLACDSTVDPSTRFYANLLKALKDVKRRALGVWLFLTFNGLFYIAIALMLPGRHLIEDLLVLYGLEPMFESPNYEIAFLLMSASVFFAMPAETSTSTFLIVFTGYVEAHMLALSQELDNLWEDSTTLYEDRQDISEDEQNNDKEVNAHVRNLLKDIVKKHITAINLLGQVEKIFRKAMAIELAFLILGLIAELLGGLENTYMQFPYTMLQVTMDCFIGQRLIDASSVLENAVYSCKWERFDKSNQRTVYLILMNSQKTLTFSVGGIIALDFTYLMSVLKSVYSIYTTLQTRI